MKFLHGVVYLKNIKSILVQIMSSLVLEKFVLYLKKKKRSKIELEQIGSTVHILLYLAEVSKIYSMGGMIHINQNTRKQ